MRQNDKVQPQTESVQFFWGDVLIIITSQKYEVCAWQTLGLQRQTIFCSVKRCYLPSLFAYDLNRGSPLKFMHRHKHPNKHTLFPLTHIQVKETNLSGECHFVQCSYEHQHSHMYVKTFLLETLAGGCCCCQSPRENGGFSLVVSWPDHTLFSPSSDCARCFKITGPWRCLAEVILSQFFGPSPGFSELFGGRLLPWWESFPGTGRETLAPAWIPATPYNPHVLPSGTRSPSCTAAKNGQKIEKAKETWVPSTSKIEIPPLWGPADFSLPKLAVCISSRSGSSTEGTEQSFDRWRRQETGSWTSDTLVLLAMSA